MVREFLFASHVDVARFRAALLRALPFLPDAWVGITGYESLTDEDELPLQVFISAEGLEPGKSYSQAITHLERATGEAVLGIDIQIQYALGRLHARTGRPDTVGRPADHTSG